MFLFVGGFHISCGQPTCLSFETSTIGLKFTPPICLRVIQYLRSVMVWTTSVRYKVVLFIIALYNLLSLMSAVCMASTRYHPFIFYIPPNFHGTFYPRLFPLFILYKAMRNIKKKVVSDRSRPEQFILWSWFYNFFNPPILPCQSRRAMTDVHKSKYKK